MRACGSISSWPQPERLGSRAKAVAALERGKVYVNETEVSLTDAARRLTAGDEVRVWMDRPGSARRKPRTGPVGDIDVIFEDDVLLVVNKPAGMLSVPLERKTELPSVYEQIEDRLSLARQAPSASSFIASTRTPPVWSSSPRMPSPSGG